MAIVLRKPTLLHTFSFRDELHEERILFILGESGDWRGQSGFGMYVSDPVDDEPEVWVRFVASAPSYMQHSALGVSIFGGDRATVFLPDEFPERGIRKLDREFYWFWPSGTLRFVLDRVPEGAYEFVRDQYPTEQPPSSLPSWHENRTYYTMFRRKVPAKR